MFLWSAFDSAIAVRLDINSATLRKQFVFSITDPGEYGLEIYANDPDVDGNSLYHAFQYLILCNEFPPTRAIRGGETSRLPPVPAGFLGPQALFKKYRLQCASHDDPYIQTDVAEFQVRCLLIGTR